jgi:cardiolipin synthase
MQFFFTPQMIHAKALLVDDKEGLVGSNNIDAQSFDYNIENGIVFQHKEMVSDLKEILETWKKSAELFDAKKHILWYHRLLSGLFRLFQPIL